MLWGFFLFFFSREYESFSQSSNSWLLNTPLQLGMQQPPEQTPGGRAGTAQAGSTTAGTLGDTRRRPRHRGSRKRRHAPVSAVVGAAALVGLVRG